RVGGSAGGPPARGGRAPAAPGRPAARTTTTGGGGGAAARGGAGGRARAGEIGSAVPFCVRGGAGWMRGRGELIEPLSLPTGLAFVVAIPPFRLSTPDVYRAWDKLRGPPSDRGGPAP